MKRKSSFEEILNKGETLYYRNVGNSMLPFIKEGEDLLVIDAYKDQRLKVGDVILYKRDTGKYVLHRIVSVRKNDYLLRGDNQYNTETGIVDRHILGVLREVIKPNQRINVLDISYQKYIKKLFITYPFRWIKFKLHRLYIRIKNEK